MPLGWYVLSPVNVPSVGSLTWASGWRRGEALQAATLSAVGFHGPMVIDLRNLSGQAEAAVKIVAAMESVMTLGAVGPWAERRV